jgi:hypothetical protein
MLQSNGYLVLDKDHFEGGCDTPPIDPSIEMAPISIRQLAEAARARNLDWFEADTPERLKKLLNELNASASIIETAIAEIEAKLP